MKSKITAPKNKTHRSTKAQLKIQEMAFMLVAVVFFFILVGLFALSITYTNLYKQANKISEDRTLSALINLADTPELACATSKANCVDADKLIALVGNKNYENFWPFSTLKVIRQPAFKKSEKEMSDCTLENYPDCERFTVYDKQIENQRIISTYIALCRKEYENTYSYERCEIAKLIAGTEIKVQGEAT
jgi:hypothetical protein